MNIEDVSGMRPKMGDTHLTLPITFDYSGGRKDRVKSVRLWSIVLGIVGLLISIGILFSQKEFYIKIPLAIGLFWGVSLIIRFVLLKEGDKKEQYKGMLSNDYKMDYKELWGIYSVEDVHPYYCRFRNGKSGLYIRLNKDVVLGKYSEAEYNHYEAIADAYNLAGAGRVQMIHIDYMDNVGTDERLEDCLIGLESVSNPDIKDLLTDMYSYQQSSMNKRVTTFDVYVFLWKGNDITAWGTIERILKCFLQANYRSYQILNERDLRELTKTVFNLNDFSVTDASAHVFDSTETSHITPISITDEFGNVTVLNKTTQEKADERKYKQQEQEAQMRELDRRKKENRRKRSKKNIKENEDIYDIF